MFYAFVTIRHVLEVLCFRAVHVCFLKVCEHSILQTVGVYRQISKLCAVWDEDGVISF